MKTFIKYSISMIAMVWTVQVLAGPGGHNSRSKMKDHKMNSEYNQHDKFSKDTVMDVQRTLNKKGYSVDVDGILGTQSRNALASFQQDQGLYTKTGELNQETVAALQISTASNSNERMEQTRQPASINSGESQPDYRDNNMRDDSNTGTNDKRY